MINYIRSNFQFHPFHLVLPSPWPIYTSLSLLALTTIGVLTINSFNNSTIFLVSAFISLILAMSLWFRDITNEATYIGDHTLAVQRGINLGIGLFILSEALFFLAIFWTYFHTSLSPIIEVGTHWPPFGIESINPFELPLLNTIILLGSGVAVTYGHHSLIEGERYGTLCGSIVTVIMALIFTIFQAVEYSVSSFSISDATYGSIFFFGTGFHGFHVMVGTAFIAVGLWRIFAYHVTDNHHLGVESSIIYWHFVDIIWLILFISVYYWGRGILN